MPRDSYGVLGVSRSASQDEIKKAILGGHATTTLPGGSAARVKISKGASSGRKLRLKGLGQGKGADRGDLYALLEIRVPAQASDELKKLAEAMAGLYADEARRPRSKYYPATRFRCGPGSTEGYFTRTRSNTFASMQSFTRSASIP